MILWKPNTYPYGITHIYNQVFCIVEMGILKPGQLLVLSYRAKDLKDIVFENWIC